MKNDQELALKVLDSCLWMTLAVTDVEGNPYSIPLHMARDGQWLYFHCAPNGKKADCMRANRKVCVTAVGEVRILQKQLTTAFECAVVYGTAEQVQEAAEKSAALHLICRRFTPQAMDVLAKSLPACLDRTGIWKIHMDEICSKRKHMDE